jgi:hypothetical protein
MIDKKLEVGDCIYIPYVELEKYIENSIFPHDKEDAKPFLNDTDVNGNLYLMIVEIAPWRTITLMELINSHGTLTNICSQFIKKCGVFVKHKELEVSEVRNSDNEVAHRNITIPKDEAEDAERVNILDAMAESKTKALQEYESEPQSIDDKIKAAEEAEANLKATGAKLIAKEAAKVLENVSSDYLDVMAGVMRQDIKVSHPSHYTWLKELCGIEVIDIARHLDFDMGNALKYLLRAGKKSEEGYSDKEKEIQDLKKAVWYIQDKIKMLEEDGRD